VLARADVDSNMSSRRANQGRCCAATPGALERDWLMMCRKPTLHASGSCVAPELPTWWAGASPLESAGECQSEALPITVLNAPTFGKNLSGQITAPVSAGSFPSNSEASHINLNLTIERLNAGRRRAREEWENMQALNAGTRTAV